VEAGVASTMAAVAGVPDISKLLLPIKCKDAA